MSLWKKARLANGVVVNVRGDSETPQLVIDGEPFPYAIDGEHGVRVISNDDNVHWVEVRIGVDRSVNVVDRSLDD